MNNWRLALAFFCCKDTQQHGCSNKTCLHFAFSYTKRNCKLCSFMFIDENRKFLICCSAKQDLSCHLKTWALSRQCRDIFISTFSKINTYFLKRCRSSAPSEVVFKVTFSISIHSFRRGSPVRSPVDLRAFRGSIKTTWQKIDEAGRCEVFSQHWFTN